MFTGILREMGSSTKWQDGVFLTIYTTTKKIVFIRFTNVVRLDKQTIVHRLLSLLALSLDGGSKRTETRTSNDTSRAGIIK